MHPALKQVTNAEADIRPTPESFLHAIFPRWGSIRPEPCPKALFTLVHCAIPERKER